MPSSRSHNSAGAVLHTVDEQVEVLAAVHSGSFGDESGAAAAAGDGVADFELHESHTVPKSFRNLDHALRIDAFLFKFQRLEVRQIEQGIHVLPSQ